MPDNSTWPVVGWALDSAAETAIILSLQTVTGETHLQVGSSGQMQQDHLSFLLTPLQCLDLSDELWTLATRILEQETPPHSGQH